MQFLINLRNQKEQKELTQKKGFNKKDLTKNLNQKDLTKNCSGNKNLFLRDKKFIQPKTEQGQSFNKNK